MWIGDKLLPPFALPLLVSLDYTQLEITLANDQTGVRYRHLTIKLNVTLLLWAHFAGKLSFNVAETLSDPFYDPTAPHAQTCFLPFLFSGIIPNKSLLPLILFYHLFSRRQN